MRPGQRHLRLDARCGVRHEKLGTHRGHICLEAVALEPEFGSIANAGGGTRTPDTRIMIPLL